MKKTSKSLFGWAVQDKKSGALYVNSIFRTRDAARKAVKTVSDGAVKKIEIREIKTK